MIEPSDAASVFSGYRFVSAKGLLIPEILKLPEILIQTDKERVISVRHPVGAVSNRADR